MRAAVIREYGAPDVFRVEELPDPTPGPGQCVVDVHAAGVNPVDYKMRQGHYRVALRYEMPRVLGLDLSGVVSAVGLGVSGFSVGDEVYASPDHVLQGCYAEKTVVKASELAHKPAALSHVEAASLPLVFQTAWQSLVDLAKLQPGEHCFIQAGSGGVGSVAIQIAKHLGARVTTTCSAKNEAFVRELGADRVIDYTKEDAFEVLSEVDVALDTLGIASVHQTRRIMKRGGRIVGITPNIPEHVRKWGPVMGLIAVGFSFAGVAIHSAFSPVRMRMHTRVPDAACMAHCAEMLERGQLKASIDRTYPLDELAQAHTYVETRRARGKVVIVVRS